MITLRYIAISFVCIFLFSTTALAQSNADAIKAIRKEVQAVNHDRTLKKVTLENEAFLENMTDGGGEVTGYYKEGKLKKVKQWVGLSNGNEITEYYFKDGHLLFVFQQFQSFVYDKQKEEFDHSKTATTFVGRFYFKGGKLFQRKTTGRHRLDIERQFDPEALFLTQVKDHIRLLNKKKNAS